MAQPNHCRSNVSPIIPLEYKPYDPEINSKTFSHEKPGASKCFIQPGVVSSQLPIEPVAQEKPGDRCCQKQAQKYRQHLFIEAYCCILHMGCRSLGCFLSGHTFFNDLLLCNTLFLLKEYAPAQDERDKGDEIMDCCIVIRQYLLVLPMAYH